MKYEFHIGDKDENIIMFPTKDLCEGCGEIKSVVDYVIWEEDE